ncbi:acyl-CoA dehydrogenase family protein [Alcaligenaceae bacterium]|nr:acyl-CoA dehydrogenase family protein [Alcaligenaceae bacterium]
MSENVVARESEFRQSVRSFLLKSLPEDIRHVVRSQAIISREQAARWQRILFEQGWAAPSWPKKYGGTGWTLTQQAIFKEELIASDAPNVESLGIDTIAPTLMRHGTDEQRQHFLPRMLSFDDYWAQGYSEPEAGSDLASLRTTAVQDGDHWVVNGSKIWQSLGHWANWAIVLVRTDPGAAKKQSGISVFLIDLESPGVTVSPIRFMTGATFHVQIFFDNVRVPQSNIVGELNRGWDIAKGLLVIERLFVARVAECKSELKNVRASLKKRESSMGNEHRMALKQRYAELEIRKDALEASWWPAVQAAENGGSPSLEASLLKLDGIQLLQDLHLFGIDLLSTDSLRFNPEALQGIAPQNMADAGGNASLSFWRYRGSSLAGGSTEIQQGIVAKAVFNGGSELQSDQAAHASEELSMMLASIRSWLDKNHSFEQRQRLVDESDSSTGAWDGMENLGVHAMCAPEQLGGLDRPASEMVELMAPLGEALVQEHILWQSALPMQLLLGLSASEKTNALITSLATAESRIAVVLPANRFPANENTPGITAAKQGNTWVLNGRAALVIGANSTNKLLVCATLDGGETGIFALAVQDLASSIRPYALHDGRTAAEITLDGHKADSTQLLAQGAVADQAVQRAYTFAILCICSETIGAARVALCTTVDFMKVRTQFNRTLSDFQLLQNRVAELYRSWVRAKNLLKQVMLDFQHNDARLAPGSICALKYIVGSTGRKVALEALHLHGAIGFQDETPISHYCKRLFDNDLIFGTSLEHLAQYSADF